MPQFVVFSHAPKRRAGVGYKVNATTRLAAAKHVFAKGGWPTNTVYVCDDTEGDRCEKYEMRVTKVSPTSKGAAAKPKTKSHGKTAKGGSSKSGRPAVAGKRKSGGFKSLARNAMLDAYEELILGGHKASKGEVAEAKRLAMGAIYEQLLLREHAPAAAKKRHNAALAGRNAADYARMHNLTAQSIAFTKKLAQEGMHVVHD
jgi:hypothetical protein